MATYGLEDLLTLMARLRDPQGGCPWDLQQDFASIVPSTLEEAHELVQAIADGDPQHIREELGDLLFQVVFYARLAEERGWFDFAAIADGLVAKLLRRHPHVFPDGTLASRRVPGDTVDANGLPARWEAIKQGERRAREHRSLMDDIPLALPAASRAQKLQKRAALAGFDWPDSAGVLAKLDEERTELAQALATGDREAQADELGDLLFTAVNLARHLQFDSETLLRAAGQRFERRFRAMEQAAGAAGQRLEAITDAERERLWDLAKKHEKAGLEPDAPPV